jgi:hypothetical protein
MPVKAAPPERGSHQPHTFGRSDMSGPAVNTAWLIATLADAYLDSLASDASPDFDAGIVFASARIADALEADPQAFDRVRFFRQIGMADPRLSQVHAPPHRRLTQPPYLPSDERLAWEEIGATSEQIGAIARVGGYAALQTHSAPPTDVKNIVNRYVRARNRGIHADLAQQGWEGFQGNLQQRNVGGRQAIIQHHVSDEPSANGVLRSTYRVFYTAVELTGHWSLQPLLTVADDVERSLRDFAGRLLNEIEKTVALGLGQESLAWRRAADEFVLLSPLNSVVVDAQGRTCLAKDPRNSRWGWGTPESMNIAVMSGNAALEMQQAMTIERPSRAPFRVWDARQYAQFMAEQTLSLCQDIEMHRRLRLEERLHEAGFTIECERGADSCHPDVIVTRRSDRRRIDPGTQLDSAELRWLVSEWTTFPADDVIDPAPETEPTDPVAP